MDTNDVKHFSSCAFPVCFPVQLFGIDIQMNLAIGRDLFI